MQKTLLFKILAVLALTALICIPMSMIEFTIRERASFREEAVQSIASDSVREQTVIGPVMILPYTDEYDEVVANAKTEKNETVTRSVRREKLVFPNELTIKGTMSTDRRYRGIHQVLVYAGDHAVSGDFVLPVQNDLPRADPKSRLTLGKPRVVIGIEDVRGLRNTPQIDFGGKKYDFAQGSGLQVMSTGLHANLDALPLDKPETIRFALNLKLEGIERQHFVPLGSNNKVKLTSPWAHPQFSGRFLPVARSITAAGFDATWEISSLATSAQQQIVDRENATAKEAGAAGLDRFSVGFIEPVNVYSLAERATKYGLLFVALTFGAFFVFEVLKRLPIHPIQYLLVGLALVLFFLLLLSLSEHIKFVWAYLIASVACITLIGFYLSFVLRNWLRGLGFGVALTMLYGALYGLLISENNALVLGSLLLFAILAAVMVATRKVDWYQMGKSEAAPATTA